MKMPDDAIEEVPWDPLKGPPPSIANTFGDSTAASSGSEEEKAQAAAVAEFQTAAAQAEANQKRLISEGEITPATQAREIKGICWMARDFPMSLRQLLPLLEAVGGANKHIAAAAGFIAAYQNHSLFPVRIKVPLMWTVYLMLRFKKFRELTPGAGEPALEDDNFFEVPRSYKKIALMAEQGAAEPVDDTFYEAHE